MTAIPVTQLFVIWSCILFTGNATQPVAMVNQEPKLTKTRDAAQDSANKTKAARVQSPQEQNYQVHLDADNTLIAEVVLDLPPSTGNPRTLTLRGVAMGLKQQVSDVRGDDKLLENPKAGTWIAPADCKTVRWKIHFQSSFAGPVIASQQRNVYFRNGRWWLISEPSSLLRISETTFESTLAFKPKALFQIGAMPCKANRWRVPESTHAPEFFAVGRVKPEKTEVDGFQVFHVADNANQVEKLGLKTAHAEALRYLLKLFPQSVDVPESERRLLIFWLGVSADNRQLGGAAGSRSFMANYIVGQTSSSDIAMNLMVIAHEQFHQLTDLCVQEDVSLPVWVNESLAQYYGLKSLSHINLPAEAVSKARNRFIDPKREIKHRLVELSRKYQQGDRSVYPMFYSQGATFWADIDHELSAATAGTKSLDDFLPIIFQAKFDETATLPQSILEPLRRAIGDKLDGLLQKYVGT